MPTYAYACTVCEHRFEAQQSFIDSSLTVCPQCTGRLRKIFPSVGVVFKGSGFYRNDSRPGHGGKVPAGSTSSNGEGGSGGSGGSGDSGDSGAATPVTAPSAPAAPSPAGPSTPSSGAGASSGAAKVGASSASAAGS